MQYDVYEIYTDLKGLRGNALKIIDDNMSGILYLSADDFIVRKGEKGNLLCLNYDVQGLSLVMFYSNECQHSTRLMAKYKQLPFNINGCQFTMINVNRPDNRRVVQLASQTIVPITYVPDVILYVDGVPYMRYDGAHEIHAIKAFIVDVYQQLQKTAFLEHNRSAPSTSGPSARPPPVPHGENANHVRSTPSSSGPATETSMRNAIPAYTIGRPKCSGERDDVCYLSFKQAYDDSKPSIGSAASNPHANGGQVVNGRLQFYNHPA